MKEWNSECYPYREAGKMRKGQSAVVAVTLNFRQATCRIG